MMEVQATALYIIYEAGNLLLRHSRVARFYSRVCVWTFCSSAVGVCIYAVLITVLRNSIYRENGEEEILYTSCFLVRLLE